MKPDYLVKTPIRSVDLVLFWMSVAFLVRFGAFVLTHLYSLNAGFGGFYPLPSGADDRYYYEAALRLLQGAGPMELPNAYPLLLSLLFAAFGPNIFMAKFSNILLGALGVGLGVWLAETLAMRRSSLWALSRPGNVAGFFLTFYPSAVFYSTQLLKDSLIWFLGLLAIYLNILLLFRPRLWHYMGFALVLFFLWSLRPYVVFVLMGAMGMYFLLKRVRLKDLLIMGSFFFAVPWLLGWGPFGWKYLSPLLSPERLARFRAEVYGIGGSSLGIELDPTHPFRFLLGWLYSSATVFLGPFPWQVDGLMEAIAFLEVIYIWPLVAVWLLGLRHLRNPGPPELLLLFALILGFGIGIFSDNLGANTRLRLLVWGALIIYAAVRLGGSGADTLPHHPSRAGGSPDAPSGTP